MKGFTHTHTHLAQDLVDASLALTRRVPKETYELDAQEARKPRMMAAILGLRQSDEGI
jgi:hypothetical protein